MGEWAGGGRLVRTQGEDGTMSSAGHPPSSRPTHRLCRIHPANCSPVVQDSTSAE